MESATSHALAASEATGPPRASRSARGSAVRVFDAFCHWLRAGNPGFPWVLFPLCGSWGSLSLSARLKNPLNLINYFSRQQPVSRLARVDRVPPPEYEDSLDFEYVAMLVKDNSQCLNSVHDCHTTQLPHEDHVAQVRC
jgi:hypothetical protein